MAEEKNLRERLEAIEKFIHLESISREEVRVLLFKMNTKVYGDEEANPPIIGLNQRLKTLESAHDERMKLKNGLLKVAIGSLTMAIGAAVLWVFGVLREGFIKH